MLFGGSQKQEYQQTILMFLDLIPSNMKKFTQKKRLQRRDATIWT